MFHPSPSDQKSGFVSSKNFYASFTTTSIPIPQGLGAAASIFRLRLDALGSLWQNDFAVSPVCHDLSWQP
jgi:hypothetical protein